jgi:N6-adenosine-specific RNA methylase IME4
MTEIQKYNAKVGVLRKKLSKAQIPEEAIEIGAGARGIEEVMQEAGLRGETEQLRPIRELWLDARWTLGRILAKMVRSPGNHKDKSLSRWPNGQKFYEGLKRLGIDQQRAKEAQRISTLPEKEKKKVYADAKAGGELPTLTMLLSAARPFWHKEKRTRRVREIEAANTSPATPEAHRTFSIIYADPPWRYEHPPIGASGRSIEEKYPTMSLEEICALPVGDLFSEDATLYLWATAPKLPECLKVMESWGFNYRTNAVWDKEIIGTGYYFRNQHEILLVGRRGDMPPPEGGAQHSSVCRERRTKHSVKPAYYRDMLDAYYPGVDKLELFARGSRPRDGWTFWGNEA